MTVINTSGGAMVVYCAGFPAIYWQACHPLLSILAASIRVAESLAYLLPRRSWLFDRPVVLERIALSKEIIQFIVLVIPIDAFFIIIVVRKSVLGMPIVGRHSHY